MVHWLKKYGWPLLIVLGMGAVLRLGLVWRPVDYRLLNPWRECDYASIAHAFYVEDFNPLFPRVAWRGDTPGYVEMELPVIPWLGAAFYRVVGYHEQVLRLMTACLSIVALFAFAHLSRTLLQPRGAFAATLLFATNGLLIALSGAIQPEALQSLFILLAVISLHQWFTTTTSKDLIVAAAYLAAAILAKATSAYLGLFFAYAVFRKLGGSAVRRPSVYAAVMLAIVPPAIWYVWAHHLFLTTGLSLGVSNETHFWNWDVLSAPLSWILGNVILEARDVFAVFGFFLALAALLQPWRDIEFVSVWFLSVVVFYIIISDTSGDMWAYYYHSMSIPPACLLMGLGFNSYCGSSPIAQKGLLGKLRPQLLGRMLLIITLLATLARGGQLAYRTLTSPALKPLYDCSLRLAGKTDRAKRIVVRGGISVDDHGHPVAYNASMVFAWMDRKGFNYASDQLSFLTLSALAQRGGDFWLAQPEDMHHPRFSSELSPHLTLVAECDSFALYDLRPLAALQ